MYNLNINFLKDRETTAQDLSGVAPIADSQFLIGGGAVAVLALAIVGGIYFFLQSQVNALQTELAQLTTQESALDAQLKVLAGSEAEVKAADERAQALASLMVRDLPASAMLQDISERISEGVQVFTIAQTGTKITITGQAAGFEEANDFLLLLQKSPYLDPTQTILGSVRQKPAVKGVELVLVDFQITTAVSPKTNDKLVVDLLESGAQGTVTRINLLKEKGVISQ